MSAKNPSLERQTLEYHEHPRPGKTEVVPTKSLSTQHDLSLAYTPGVAIPCLKIQDEPDDAYRYTNRGNLVAVITNGTAVLGLGNIGSLAGKPVMEGKAVLFKKFAGIDVFDIEIDELDPDAFVDTVRRIAPTFGGINLEDIKAPECFEIERRLKDMLDIPVFHDDQHGTAIIAGAALVNAVEVSGKRLADMRVAVSGAGAAGIACIDFFVSLGMDPEKVLFADSRGVIYQGRTTGMNAEKQRIARPTEARTLADAMKGADLFLGLSGPDLVTQDMVRSMAPNPIVFAMANPDPEITYPDAVAARPDVLMATGRSDYPNQVNNVLCFPFMFRGALDVGARRISDGMKLAAARALAALAREDVPESVMEAYGGEELRFGPRYLIPKPFDHRVLLWVAPAVAEAAVKEGNARVADFDVAAYRRSLERYLGGARQVMAAVTERARRVQARIAFAGAEETRALRAATQIQELGLGVPMLVGDRRRIQQAAKARGIDLGAIEIIDPDEDPRHERLAQRLYELRWRRGVSRRDAPDKVRHPRRYALTLLEQGEVDCVVTGIGSSYPEAVRDALQIIGTKRGKAAALHVMALKDRVLFLADTSINIDPSARDLADIAVAASEMARDFDYEPRVAMISYSNFGSVETPAVRRVQEAVEIVRSEHPELVIDGEMHLDIALSAPIAQRLFPDSRIQGNANVLVFPDLASGNVGYKLLEHLAGAESVGPVLMGMRKPVVVTYQAASVQTIVNLAAAAIAHANRH